MVLRTRKARSKVKVKSSQLNVNYRNVWEAKLFVSSVRTFCSFPGFTFAGNGAKIDSFIGYNMSGRLFSTHVLFVKVRIQLRDTYKFSKFFSSYVL